MRRLRENSTANVERTITVKMTVTKYKTREQPLPCCRYPVTPRRGENDGEERTSSCPFSIRLYCIPESAVIILYHVLPWDVPASFPRAFIPAKHVSPLGSRAQSGAKAAGRVSHG